MKQRHVHYLLVTLAVLIGVYVFLTPRTVSHENGSATTVLAGIDANAVAIVSIEKGADSVELAKKDGSWVLPSRADYPADRAKLNAFLLKMFDLPASQKLPSAENEFEALGVTDAAVKNGKAKITFKNEAGTEIATLFVGEQRKSKATPGGIPSVGQYVRRGDDQSVYLVPDTVVVASDVPGWLDSLVTNVLQSTVLSVKEMTVSGDESHDLVTLGRETAGDAGSKFLVQTGLGKDVAVNDSAVAQANAALENLKLNDVEKSDSEVVKGLSFDRRAEVAANNGLIYVVDSAEKDANTFIRLSARLDEQLVADLRAKEAAAKAEEEKKKQDQQLASSSSSSSGDAVGAAVSSSSSAVPVKPPVAPATEEMVKEINSKHSPWVYKLDTFRGKKFRMGVDDFIKREAAAPAPQG